MFYASTNRKQFHKYFPIITYGTYNSDAYGTCSEDKNFIEIIKTEINQ